MLGIYHELVQKIARTKAPHSWAKKLMLLPVEEADKAEAKVLDWIAETVQERYPGADSAERMVRDYWLHVLEWRAIDRFTDRYPGYQQILPTLMSGRQAVWYAEADLMWPDPEQGRIAAEIMDEIKEGKLKPDMEKILG